MTSESVVDGYRAALLRGILRPKINRLTTHLAKRAKNGSARIKKGELMNDGDEQAKHHLARLREHYDKP